MRAVLTVVVFLLIGTGGPVGIAGAVAGPDSAKGSVRNAPMPGTGARSGLDSFPASADPPSSPAWSSVCCRVCEEGKACGDTCIAAEETCTEAEGCACDRTDQSTTRLR